MLSNCLEISLRTLWGNMISQMKTLYLPIVSGTNLEITSLIEFINFTIYYNI